MTRLDSRTWLVWGACSMVPLLIARQPWLVVTMLCIVATVRTVCVPKSARAWGWILRLAVAFGIIGVVFNALTVRSGNQYAFTLPVLGWDITWNAIAYGVVSGIAMVALVLVGITTAAGLDWISLTRVLPARLAPLAVAGSVAWSFLPSASQAFGDIREAQAARGHQIRSGRDILPIVVPLLDTSLGKAMTMSEALEARGFGASNQLTASKSQWVSAPGLLVLAGTLGLAIGVIMASLLTVAASAALIGIGWLVGRFLASPQAVTTRYRESLLAWPDIVVMFASVASLLAMVVLASQVPHSVNFNPYPNLKVPILDYRVLLALFPLLAPAFFPVPGDES